MCKGKNKRYFGNTVNASVWLANVIILHRIIDRFGHVEVIKAFVFYNWKQFCVFINLLMKIISLSDQKENRWGTTAANLFPHII